MRRHVQLPELGAHRRLESLVLLEPARQFGVLPDQFQRVGDLGIGRAVYARPVQQEDLLGLRPVHEGSSFGKAACPRTKTRSWASPRAMRDFTVPKGAPRISAISL